MKQDRAGERTLPVVTCAGSPRERGERHGEALRDQIADGLARWTEAIAAAHRVDPDASITEFVRGDELEGDRARRCPAVGVDLRLQLSLGPERRSMTFGAVVDEASVPPRMWLAPGPPHLTAFRLVPWSPTPEETRRAPSTAAPTVAG